MTSLIEQLEHYFGQEGPPGVVSAYLFGSEAEGRAHTESDVDVGVLLDWSAHPDPLERARLRERMIADVVHVLLRNEVDLVVLNDVPPLLGRRIATEGTRVFLADAEADRVYRRDIQLRAADLEPWLRRMRRLKLERLKE